MILIQNNKKAHHDYFIEDKLEVGIKLVGSEIKSVRNKKVSINEAFISFRKNEAYIINMQIAKYEFSNQFNHEEKRDRKLLMHKREIIKWESKLKEQGYTAIPLKIYIKDGLAKIEIALAKGKKLHDKRRDLKEKDMNLRINKILKRG